MSWYPKHVRRIVGLLMLGASASAGVACAPADIVVAPEAGYGVIRIHAYDNYYAAGTVIPMVVNNVGPTTLSIGSCADGMEKLVDNAWRATTAFGATQHCDLVLYVVRPGEFIAIIIPAPLTLAPGTYRARFDGIRVVGPNMGTTNLPLGVRYSESFQVVAAA